jgi:hypothetical protein
MSPQGPFPPQGWAPAPPTQPKKSNTGMIIGIVAAVVLLCGGGGVGAVLLIRNAVGVENVLPSTTVPVDESRTPTNDPSDRLPTIEVAAPDMLGNRAKLTDADHTQLAADTETVMMRDPGVSYAVVAYYGTADAMDDKVYLAASTTKVALSKTAFEATFNSMASGAGLSDMTDVTDVDPGPLGGYAKCGMLEIATMPVATCAWADEGSFATVMWYNRQLSDEIKAEFISIRGVVETKS